VGVGGGGAGAGPLGGDAAAGAAQAEDAAVDDDGLADRVELAPRAVGPHDALRPLEPAAALDREPHLLLHPLTVVGMEAGEEQLERDLARARLEAVDAVELIRPGHARLPQPPLPAPDVGDLLRGRELPLDALERAHALILDPTPKDCGKEAVRVVAVGAKLQDRPGGVRGPERPLGTPDLGRAYDLPAVAAERCRDILVLGPEQRARRVDEAAARGDQRPGAAGVLALLRGQAREVLLGEPPPRLRVAPERADAGAGRVDEDAVGARLGEGVGLDSARLDVGQPGAPRPPPELVELLAVDVEG